MTAANKIRHGTLLVLAFAGLCANVSLHATVLLQEGFDYSAGTLGTNPPWAGSSSLITVTNSTLSFPNLSTFSPASQCASVAQGPTAVSYRPMTTTASSGVVYFSFLIDFTVLPASYYIAGLVQSTNAPPGGSADDPLDFIDDASGLGFKLGVRGKGTAVSYVTNQLGDLMTNTTYFLVLKYNFTNGQASLYLDPQPGAAEPSVPDAASVTTTAVPNLADVYLRSGNTAAGDFLISSLCVATTWGEATAGTATPNAVTTNGLLLNAYLDSFQVTNFWLDGYSVNWLTGATNGNGPNMTIGTASHCSAFAPAVAELLGIYLLRPPQESDVDLANAQAQWFVTNADGWYPIDSMIDAQHQANTGVLVMGSYYSTSGSGHIAVLRASTRTDASVYSYGPEECQSGESNYGDTNAVTGFNQHPGAFPNNIYWYGHTVTAPYTPVWPAFTRTSISNGDFVGVMNTIVGRPYKVQQGSNLINWTTAATFTNSNVPTNFFTTPVLTAPTNGAAQQFYDIIPALPE